MGSATAAEIEALKAQASVAPSEAPLILGYGTDKLFRALCDAGTLKHSKTPTGRYRIDTQGLLAYHEDLCTAAGDPAGKGLSLQEEIRLRVAAVEQPPCPESNRLRISARQMTVSEIVE